MTFAKLGLSLHPKALYHCINKNICISNPENMIPWIPCYCTAGKNQIQPYYLNKLLKCVIVKIYSDTKAQNFDAAYKRKSKLSQQINQVGSEKSDQSDSLSWQQRSRFEASVIDEKQDSLITKEGYSSFMYFIIRTTRNFLILVLPVFLLLELLWISPVHTVYKQKTTLLRS